MAISDDEVTTERERALAAARDYNPYDVEFLEHEFETYDLMREHCPIARSSQAGGPMGAIEPWVITSYGPSTEFLQDAALFSSQTQSYPLRPWIPQAIDPPMHTSYRRIMNPWFTVDALRPLDGHLEDFAAELVDAMVANDRFDFIAGFADPFPTKIFCELAGFPPEDYERIMDWKNILMHCNDGHGRGRELAGALARELGHDLPDDGLLPPDAELAIRAEVGQRIYLYLGELLAVRRSERRDDMVSRLLDAEVDGRPLTQEELEDTLFLFFMAGLDTVASALGLIVEGFARDAQKRREFIELMEDEARLGPAIEELVRVHAIVLLPRRVTQDAEFNGAEFAENDMVLCPTMAANRDADEFESPHEIDFDRSPNRHLGFGLGPHRCIGIHLARRELKIALQAFHRACPDYTLDPDAEVERFGGMKGLASLPLVKG